MKARYNYRIYPNKKQQDNLARCFGCVRVVWNDSLGLINATPDGEKWPSNGDLQKLCITQAKRTPERQWLKEVSAVCLQQSVADLGVAFKNFFESRNGKRKGRKSGFPRFKSRHDKQAARFVGTAFSLKGNKLFLAKMGLFKVRWSRPLPAPPSSVTITLNKAGQYHASFVVEVQSISVEPLRSSIGIDLGIKVFAFPSHGEAVHGPSYTALNRRVARLNRKLARCKKGSNRRQSAKKQLAKAHLKIANIRKDFLHKLSTKLIRENQTVCLEDLNVSGMLKNRCLSRAISEQGWSAFRAMLESKAAMYADRKVSIISRWEPTSQTCSDCGFRWGKLDLSVRGILCISCGVEHDRDQNAARNIERVGAGLAHDIKRTLRECKPSLLATPSDASNHKVESFEQLTLFAAI